MYAVIRAGGKQHKVAPGDVIEVERLKGAPETIEFTPVLVVDDKGRSTSQRSDLVDARVHAKVVGEVKGPKVDVYKFKNKSGYRRHTGHRQKYTTVQISEISLAGKKSSRAADKERSDGS